MPNDDLDFDPFAFEEAQQVSPEGGANGGAAAEEFDDSKLIAAPKGVNTFTLAVAFTLALACVTLALAFVGVELSDVLVIRGDEL